MHVGRNSEPFARFFFHPDINLRSRVFTHPHKNEFCLYPTSLESLNARNRLGMNLLRDRAAIDKVVCRHQGALSIVSTCRIGTFGQRSSIPSSPVTITF